MQLIVESVAVTLFRSVAKAGVEPVLSELMPYFERDEARHVGLGVLYLPQAPRQARAASRRTRLKLQQLKIVTLIGWGTHLKKRHFETLGIDNNDGFRRGFRLNREVLKGMRSAEGEDPPGVLVGDPRLDVINDWAIDLFFPRLGATRARRGSAPSSTSSTSSAASATARCGWRHDAGQARAITTFVDRRHVRRAHAAARLHGAVTADARRRRDSPGLSGSSRRLAIPARLLLLFVERRPLNGCT